MTRTEKHKPGCQQYILSRAVVLLKPIWLRRKSFLTEIGFDFTPERPVNPIKFRSRDAGFSSTSAPLPEIGSASGFDVECDRYCFFEKEFFHV